MPAGTFKARCLEHNHPLQADPFEYIHHIHLRPLNKVPKQLEASTSTTETVDAEDLSPNVARPTETSTSSTQTGDAEYDFAVERETSTTKSMHAEASMDSTETVQAEVIDSAQPEERSA
jgi:hypothetical protein